MARIVFIMDTEEGHILPSFGLAQSLKESGHEIIYLSVADNEDLVKEYGFAFYPMLENVYPKGFKRKLKEFVTVAGINASNDDSQFKTTHIDVLLTGYYESFLAGLGADLFVVSEFLRIDSLLLHYKLKIYPVILTPFLREAGRSATTDCLQQLTSLPAQQTMAFIEYLSDQDIDFSSMKQIVRPMDDFCELVLCPEEFEIDKPSANPNVNYIGPSIRKIAGPRDIYASYGVPAGKKIVYASMGSQAIRHGNICDVFFRKLILLMEQPALQPFHLILCVGAEYDKDTLCPASGNVSVVGWAPQVDILQVASLAIIHGGLGSVKECIYYGVPMIVFPLAYDQPSNAQRVKYHKLGVMDDIRLVSVPDLVGYCTYLSNDEEVSGAVGKMRRIFEEKEKTRPGVRIIEALLMKA